VTPTDYAIAFSAGASATVFIFERTYRLVREKSNGKARTFADDPVGYWDQMKAVVTEPLSKILDKQTMILEKQVEGNNEVMLKLVALDERTQRQTFIRGENQAPWAGEERRRGR